MSDQQARTATVKLHEGPLDGEWKEITEREVARVQTFGSLAESPIFAWPDQLVFEHPDDPDVELVYETRAGGAQFNGGYYEFVWDRKREAAA